MSFPIGSSSRIHFDGTQASTSAAPLNTAEVKVNDLPSILFDASMQVEDPNLLAMTDPRYMQFYNAFYHEDADQQPITTSIPSSAPSPSHPPLYQVFGDQLTYLVNLNPTLPPPSQQQKTREGVSHNAGYYKKLREKFPIQNPVATFQNLGSSYRKSLLDGDSLTIKFNQQYCFDFPNCHIYGSKAVLFLLMGGNEQQIEAAISTTNFSLLEQILVIDKKTQQEKTFTLLTLATICGNYKALHQYYSLRHRVYPLRSREYDDYLKELKDLLSLSHLDTAIRNRIVEAIQYFVSFADGNPQKNALWRFANHIKEGLQTIFPAPLLVSVIANASSAPLLPTPSYAAPADVETRNVPAHIFLPLSAPAPLSHPPIPPVSIQQQPVKQVSLIADLPFVDLSSPNEGPTFLDRSPYELFQALTVEEKKLAGKEYIQFMQKVKKLYLGEQKPRLQAILRLQRGQWGYPAGPHSCAILRQSSLPFPVRAFLWADPFFFFQLRWERKVALPPAFFDSFPLPGKEKEALLRALQGHTDSFKARQRTFAPDFLAPQVYQELEETFYQLKFQELEYRVQHLSQIMAQPPASDALNSVPCYIMARDGLSSRIYPVQAVFHSQQGLVTFLADNKGEVRRLLQEIVQTPLLGQEQPLLTLDQLQRLKARACQQDAGRIILLDYKRDYEAASEAEQGSAPAAKPSSQGGKSAAGRPFQRASEKPPREAKASTVEEESSESDSEEETASTPSAFVPNDPLHGSHKRKLPPGQAPLDPPPKKRAIVPSLAKAGEWEVAGDFWMSVSLKALDKVEKQIAWQLKHTQPALERIHYPIAHKLQAIAEPAVLLPLHQHLKPYQLEGLKWIKKLAQAGVRGILGPDMGLGKTAIFNAAVVQALVEGKLGPKLYVIPLSPLRQTQRDSHAFISRSICGIVEQALSYADLSPQDYTLVLQALSNALPARHYPEKEAYHQTLLVLRTLALFAQHPKVGESCTPFLNACREVLALPNLHRYLQTYFEEEGSQHAEFSAHLSQVIQRALALLEAKSRTSQVFARQSYDMQQKLKRARATLTTAEAWGLFLELFQGQMGDGLFFALGLIAGDLMRFPVSNPPAWEGSRATLFAALNLLAQPLTFALCANKKALKERLAQPLAGTFIFTTLEALDGVEETLLAQADFDAIILDEAHTLNKAFKEEIHEKKIARNKNAIVSHLLKQLEERNLAPLVVASTGTPFENSLSEMWTLLATLNPHQFEAGEYEALKKYLDTAKQALEGRLEKPLSAKTYAKIRQGFLQLEGFQRLCQMLIYRVRKEDPRIRQQWSERIPRKNLTTLALADQLSSDLAAHILAINSQPSTGQGDIFKKNKQLHKILIHQDLVAADLNPNQVPDLAAQASLAELQAKAPKVAAFLTNERFRHEMEHKEHVLVFVDLLVAGDLVQKLLKRWYPEVDTRFFHGNLEERARDQYSQWFSKKEDRAKVMITMIKSGGVAHNWKLASQIHMFASWWNPGVIRQAHDRAVRANSDRAVVDIFEYHCGTWQEKHMQVVLKKKEAWESFLFPMQPESAIARLQGFVALLQQEIVQDKINQTQDVQAAKHVRKVLRNKSDEIQAFALEDTSLPEDMQKANPLEHGTSAAITPSAAPQAPIATAPPQAPLGQVASLAPTRPSSSHSNAVTSTPPAVLAPSSTLLPPTSFHLLPIAPDHSKQRALCAGSVLIQNEQSPDFQKGVIASVLNTLHDHPEYRLNCYAPPNSLDPQELVSLRRQLNKMQGSFNAPQFQQLLAQRPHRVEIYERHAQGFQLCETEPAHPQQRTPRTIRLLRSGPIDDRHYDLLLKSAS